MLDQRHTVGNDDGVKTLPRGSSHHNPIARNQVGASRGPHKNGFTSVLHKQQIFVGTCIADRGLEGDWNMQAGFGIRQIVNRAQGGERGRRRSPRSRSPNQNQCDSEKRPLHREQFRRTRGKS